MQRARNISVVLLSISAIIGIVRGYRMTLYPEGNFILFPYPKDAIKDSVFSNYAVLGWILFFFIGIFSVLVLVCMFRRVRYYGYLIVIQGVFLTFFTLIHIVLTGFGMVHAFIFPLCITTLVAGVMQTPKEF